VEQPVYDMCLRRLSACEVFQVLEVVTARVEARERAAEAKESKGGHKG
jgi:hypothetical protein